MIKLLLELILAKSITELWENKDLLWLYVRTLFGKYRNKEIRFSISYLFKINIPDTDNYLLVLNRRINNQLQPVGGVYKRYGDDKLFSDWDYQLDSNINGLGTDRQSSKDLRFRVKGKNVIKAIKWFETGREREISADREFIEELLDTSILDSKTFQKINYKHLKRASKNLKYSDFHQCYEVLIYDIMELIPNEEQKVALKGLANKPNNIKNGFVIVSSDEIAQLRYMENNIQIAKIGEHTKLIINKTF